METLEEKIGDVKVLQLRGRLDLESAPEFKNMLLELFAGGEKKVVLDCRELKYVSSSGLGAFIACGKQVPDGGTLAFTDLTKHIHGLFEMTGIAGLFAIYKTRLDALRQLGVAAE